jgi:hypothetical protein
MDWTSFFGSTGATGANPPKSSAAAATNISPTYGAGDQTQLFVVIGAIALVMVAGIIAMIALGRGR